MERRLSTSESMTKGHPDKICGQISDTALDVLLAEDPESHMTCETSTTTSLVTLMGEISIAARTDYQQLVRDTIRETDYMRDKYGLNCDTCAVLTAFHERLPDIAQEVNYVLEECEGERKWDLGQGAGNQGLMFGYAYQEMGELMPCPISLARELCRKLIELRKTKKLLHLRPGGKSQITVEYDKNGKPACLGAVVFSTQRDPGVSQEKTHADIRKYTFGEVLPVELVDRHTRFHTNSADRFVIGGPNGDAGLTGRKIIVDTYSGCARHGGGVFSGKDPPKMDRPTAYVVRYAVKNLVVAGLMDSVEIQLFHAVGAATPTSVSVNSFGADELSDEQFYDVVRKEFDLRPAGITRMLDLERPICRQTAAYGHFGREDLSLPWEKTDRAEQLKKYLT